MTGRSWLVASAEGSAAMPNPAKREPGREAAGLRSLDRNYR